MTNGTEHAIHFSIFGLCHKTNVAVAEVLYAQDIDPSRLFYGAFWRTGLGWNSLLKMVRQPLKLKASIIVLKMPSEGFLPPFLRLF